MISKSVYLIGAGRMGRAHAQAAVDLGLSLEAICDTRKEVRESFAKDFDVAKSKCFANAEEMFDSLGGAELVIVATTADTHCELVCLAASAASKAVLCEKPMAVSVEQCDRMIDACEKSGTALAVNHQMRFMPQYALVKKELERGELGLLASMNVVAGCFGLAMNGSHYIEAFNYLTGTWPSKVSGHFTGEPFQNPRGPRYFDQAGEYLFISESGQRLKLSIGHDQGHGMTSMYATQFGHVFVDELQGEMIVTARLLEHQSQPMTRYGMPWDRKTIAFPQADNVGPTREVMSALLQGENYPSGGNGKKIVASLAAAYASAQKNSVLVRIDSNDNSYDQVFPWA